MPNDAFTLPDVPGELRSTLAEGGAIAWEQGVTIDTYEPAEPDRYPMFLDRRVYQGSSGKVYPLPFIDRIATESTPRQWKAIHLENEWIRLMVLPELGGRIHVGFDKIAGYDFFYRNNVIKPALVGLAGPWVSGGVEFNWPQHHRPATFLPVEYEIEHGTDGSVTVWCSDHDPFTRMKGMHGIRLYPDRAVVELVGRLHNRTSETQTFLWWANVAARVHDDYQSFFPTDVHFVADHARRAITAFPAADRPYYGVNYPALAATGGDRLDFYRNIPVPTSYMIVKTDDDFFGGYDHAANAGFVHVADRHVAPGKKQWTWGNAPFGHAWDALLTDNDGPYVELMAGVYTDNQPDFSWLQPGETKTFTQTWFPIQQIGVVHQSTLEAAVHLEVQHGIARVGVCVTRDRPTVRVTLSGSGDLLLDWHGELAPGRPLLIDHEIGEIESTELELVVWGEEGELLRWRPRADVPGPEPEAATEPPLPTEIASVDELYLTGIHLAQYRHPTRSPLPYWQEAITRDPFETRSNLALGDDAYRRGLYELAETYIRTALTRLTARNGNPRDGEASYLLGLVLTRLHHRDAAIDAFAKAAWDGRWASPALFEAARLHASAGNDSAALDYAGRAAAADPNDPRVRILEAVVLRRNGKPAEAGGILAAVSAADPLDQSARALLEQSVSADGRTLIDIALDLARVGALDRALVYLQLAANAEPSSAGEVRPLANYHRAALLDQLGRTGEADAARREARQGSRVRCFPSGLDDHDVLLDALRAEPNDTTALSLLATLLVDRARPAEALELWRRAINLGLDDAVAYRNAAVVSFNLTGDAQLALDWYQRALRLRPKDARLWYESDQLLHRAGAIAAVRLLRLEPVVDVLAERDDAIVEFCDLLVAEGRPQEAVEILSSRRFAPWEGGEGRSLAAWESAHVSLARRALGDARPEDALAHIASAFDTPANLGEARHPLASTAVLLLIRADALDALGRRVEAASTRADAATQPPVAGRSLGPVDYFATSLPELLLFAPPEQPLAD